EFKDNREVYNWLVREAGFERPPEQTEFARLNLDFTVVSKRKLLKLVNEGHVSGWDDPRLHTLSGIRRRGVTPEAIRNFCETVGVARKDARTELAAYEHAVRDDLNMRVPRVMAVTKPLKVVLTNYPEGQVEQLEAPSYPHDVPKTGSRMVPFSRELYIERDDFMEDPPKKFFRLAPGREGRRRAGRPEGARDDPLGLRRPGAERRAPALRSPVHDSGSGGRGRGARLHVGPEPRLA